MSEKRPAPAPAPISASAYAFSLSTPKRKKVKKEHGVFGRNIQPQLQHQHQAESQTQAQAQPQPQVKLEPRTPRPITLSFAHTTTLVKSEPPSRATTPLRSIDAADVKPLPRYAETPTPRRLTDLKPIGAFVTPLPARTGDPGDPAGLGPSSSKPLRRINERMANVTPQTDEGADTKPKSKPRFALHDTLIDEKMADDLFMRTKKAQLVEEDEGIGVSPRGKRIAKWTGKGAPPPSVHLANLLSSANASLHLFYTSMQHLLYPSDRSAISRSRQTRDEPTSRPTTPFQHIQHSAPLRLRVLDPIPGPTHNSTMFWCEPLKWNATFSPKRVLLVLQPLPNECPRLGVDPKLLATKMGGERGKAWQIGIWLWTDIDLPESIEMARSDAMGEQEQGSQGDGDEPGQPEEAQRPRPYKPTIALLATRYLVAEQPSA